MANKKRYVVYDLEARRYVRTDTALDEVAFATISVGGETGPVLTATSDGQFDVSGTRLTNAAWPTTGSDLATKEYVDLFLSSEIGTATSASNGLMSAEDKVKLDFITGFVVVSPLVYSELTYNSDGRALTTDVYDSPGKSTHFLSSVFSYSGVNLLSSTQTRIADGATLVTDFSYNIDGRVSSILKTYTP